MTKKNNEEEISLKLKILLLNQCETKDLKLELISNYSELNKILFYLAKKEEKRIIKFLYFIKYNVHKLLYEEEEIINIDSFVKGKLNYNEYYYLSLLLSENAQIINYSYSIEFIKQLNEILLESKQSDIRKIFISKIIIELINNYRGLDCYDEEKEKEVLDSIEENNKKFIKELAIFNNLKKELIINKKIDELYIEIINELIKDNNFENTEIINQLDLEDIFITKKMFNELSKTLNTDFVKEYLINNKDDLFNEKKINFNYNLLKYIFKDSYYIYQEPFLLKTKKFILQLFRKNELPIQEKDNSTNTDIKDKLDYIIKRCLDSEYYYNIKKIPPEHIVQLKEIQKYYQEYLFESKKEDIDTIEDIINNNKMTYKKYLVNYDLALKMNNKLPIINYLYYDNKKKDSEDELKKAIKIWNDLETIITDKKIKNLRIKNKIKLNEFFKNPNNKEILLKIFAQDTIDYFINQTNKEIENNINKKKDENAELNENNKDINQTNKKPNNNKNNLETFQKDNTSKDSKNTNNTASNEKTKTRTTNDQAAPTPFNSEPSKIEGNFSISLYTNEKGKEPFLIIDKYIDNKGTKLSGEEFEKFFGQYKNNNDELNKLENNYKKLYEFFEDFKKKLAEVYNKNYKLEIDLIFENKKKFNNNGLYEMSCEYVFHTPNKKGNISFREDNILINGLSSPSQGFQYMVLDINDESYKDIKYEKKMPENNGGSKDKSTSANNNLTLKNLNDSNRVQTYIKTNYEFEKTASELNILELIKIVDTDCYYNGTIKEINNGYYIISKSDNTIAIYNIYLTRKMVIKGFEEPVFNVCPISNNNEKGKKQCQIIACSKKDLALITLDLNNFSYSQENYDASQAIINSFKIKKINYIVLGIKNAVHYIDLFNIKNAKKNVIINKTYFSGCKINENIIALASNSIIKDGEDTLVFYNIRTKKTSNEIKGYSFVYSPNGFAIMPREVKKGNKENNKTKNNRILICACKKYKNGQKNGILLINPHLGDNQRCINEFYETYNFEVHCICPIFIVEKNNIDYDNINEKDETIVIDTNYFLIGGFDLEKQIGIIKLFKVIFKEKAFQTEIEYLQDIEIDNNDIFDEFDGPINNIIQSKITGNIIVSSYNGKVYLLTKPNLSFYMKDENIKKVN